MNDLQLISKVNDKVNKASRPNRGGLRAANSFVGEPDMYPQFDTGAGWYTQTVDGIEYTKFNDLWLSSQLFTFRRYFDLRKNANGNAKFITTFQDIYYIEDLTVATINTSTNDWRVALYKNNDFIIVMQAPVGYHIHINLLEAVMYSNEWIHMEIDGYATVDVEVSYRRIL